MSKYDFGNKLYALRTEKDLTQKELAKILGVSDKAVSKWETGEAMPRLKTLQLIAECFSVSYEDLLSEKDGEKTTPPMVITEPADNPYERFYNKRLNGNKKRIKVELVLFALLILFSFCTIIFGNLAATFLGMMRQSLVRNILFNLAPIFLSIGVWFLAHKTLSEIDSIDTEQFAQKYYPALTIPIIITAVLFAVQNLISGNTGIVILFAGTSILTLFSLIIAVIKKNECTRYIDICSDVIGIFLFLNLLSIAKYLITSGFNIFIQTITIAEMLGLVFEINDLLRKIQTLKKVDTPLNPKKAKFKKFAVRLFIVLISLLIIVSVILNLFPGILVKYTLAKSWENPNVTFFEHYDMKFEEGEATTFRIGDITIDMPVNYTMEERSFDENEERYWWYIEEDKMACSLEKFPLMSMLYGNDDELYTTSSALQEQSDKERFKNMLINTFGTYPRNEFEYKKLMYSLDADDINVFNYEQCVTYTVLLAGRDMYTMGNFYDIILYERNEIGVEIMKLKNTDREMYAVSIFVTGDEYEYHITFNGTFESVDVLYKMLNSIEVV
jgi:transcriptional regulator with XRE-family HTH domain